MINRRRCLQITAAAASMGLVGAKALALSPQVKIAEWRGVALGGMASMRIVHSEPKVAKNMIETAVAELRRLEKIFSLYDPESSLSKLNRDGALSMPPAELVMLLTTARHISKASKGLFDVSVQPLWDHYSHALSGEQVSPATIIKQEHIGIDRALITLAEGQKITLNGIAQGAITDHLMALFKEHGFRDLLLNTGEISAVGSNKNKRPWRVALGDQDGPTVELINAAIATSEAIPMKTGSAYSHFFNPLTGMNENHFNRVSVVAPNATYADGLSTALMLSPEDTWLTMLSHFTSMKLAVHYERKDESLGSLSI